MQSNEYIQFFDGGIEPKLENLGGKGASLVTMTSAGMPVPPGFVVTTAQFDAFMEEAGITRHIHQLERELGVTLFVRHRQGVTLTPAGQQLLDRARRLDAAALEFVGAARQARPDAGVRQ